MYFFLSIQNNNLYLFDSLDNLNFNKQLHNILIFFDIFNLTLNLLGDTTFGKYRPKFLIALEAIIMLIALYIFIHSTPQSSIILIHILLMDSVVSVWMETQTHSINQLLSELYIHDSSVLNNSLQVTKPIETPFAFSVLTSVMNQYLSKIVYPDSLSNISEAITLGVNHVFIVLSVVIFIRFNYYQSSILIYS